MMKHAGELLMNVSSSHNFLNDFLNDFLMMFTS